MIGKTISHYKILKKLGEGGMGVVYKAEDTDLKRTVALKFLSPQALAGDEEKARFVHEAQAAAALNHPNICTIYEIGKSEGNSFIAMECIEGQSLKDTICAGPLEIDKAVDIAVQIGSALQKAHEKEIVHRDMKPGNVMVTPDGQVKIMDFGLAKSSEHTRLTRTGSTVGTVAYMSPEQTRGDEVDHRTDVWSLGVILYEMVTGRVPFGGEFEQAVLYSILNEDPKPISGFRSPAPEGLQRIIDKALKKDAGERYQSTDELLADLSRLQAGKRVSAIGERTERVSIHRKRLLAGVGVVVVIAAVIFLSPYVAPPGIIPILTGDSLDEGPGVPAGGLQEDRFVVAVAPFWGQAGDAAEEAEVMQALIERSIRDELGGEEDVMILAKDIKEVPRSHDEARALGVKLSATIVLWGEILVLRNEVEIQPFMTVVESDWWKRDRSGAVLLANLKEPNQLGLRRAKAEEVRNLALMLASVYFRDEDPDKALSVLQKISPPTSESARRQANIYVNMGSFEEASRLLNEAIELNPDDALAIAGLGDVCQVRGDIQTAVEHYQMACQLDSTLAYPRHNLGLMYYWQGRQEAAIAEYEKSIELAPDFHWPYNSLGMVYRDQGKLDEAIALFEKAIEVNPGYALAYMNLGYSYWIQGENEKATAQFSEAVQIDPKSAWFQSTLGYAHSLNAHYEEAMEACQKAVHLNRGNPQVYSLVGLTYLHVGGCDSAVSMLSKAVELYPGNAEYIIPLALAYLELGQYDAAVSSMEAVVQSGSTEPYSRLLYSIVLNRAGRAADASAHIGEFVKTLKDSATATVVARFYAGECTEEDVLSAVEDTDPQKTKEQQVQAFYYLGMAHLLGLCRECAPADPARASEYLEKCVATDLRVYPEYGCAKRELERLAR